MHSDVNECDFSYYLAFHRNADLMLGWTNSWNISNFAHPKIATYTTFE